MSFQFFRCCNVILSGKRSFSTGRFENNVFLTFINKFDSTLYRTRTEHYKRISNTGIRRSSQILSEEKSQSCVVISKFTYENVIDNQPVFEKGVFTRNVDLPNGFPTASTDHLPQTHMKKETYVQDRMVRSTVPLL